MQPRIVCDATTMKLILYHSLLPNINFPSDSKMSNMP